MFLMNRDVGDNTEERESDVNGSAQRRFDRWAEERDRSILSALLFRPCYMAMCEEIAKFHVASPGPFTLLDVGCGAGSFASLLLATSWPVTVLGLDDSSEKCQRAAENLLPPIDDGAPGGDADDRRAFVLQADSEHIPLADGSVDLVTCANSFHRYPHQPEVVREVHRVLRPGGRFLLLDGFRDNVIGWFVFDVLARRAEKGVHHCAWTEIDRFFHQAGLTVIGRRKINTLLPVLVTVGEVPNA